MIVGIGPETEKAIYKLTFSDELQKALAARNEAQQELERIATAELSARLMKLLSAMLGEKDPMMVRFCFDHYGPLESCTVTFTDGARLRITDLTQIEPIAAVVNEVFGRDTTLVL